MKVSAIVNYFVFTCGEADRSNTDEFFWSLLDGRSSSNNE